MRTPAPAPEAPRLDREQQRVVDHAGGPLLVLAGPGTGKTTTLVEAVAARVRRGLAPEQVLVLTFSRRAAVELRSRITTRLGRTVAAPSAWTFHSFCYALVRHWQPAEQYLTPVQLLSAPEHDVLVRELVRGSVEEHTVDWPARLAPALPTRGLAGELRGFMTRARELGLDPDDLADVARAAGRTDWMAAARFLTGYLDVLDATGSLDYAELVHRAVIAAERPEHRAELRQRFRAVFVDEYQDTDPAQERLLQALAGGGGDLVVVGDPDQSIYAFRGADVSNILRFADRFPTVTGDPAPVAALRRSRRAGPVLLSASRAVAGRLPLPGLPAGVGRDHRDLSAADAPSPGAVEVYTFPSPGTEVAGIADLLRRAHLVDRLPWSSMAVLVRSGVRSVPGLRRALLAAGVPVRVAGDELPLAHEPAVAPLLTALRCADDPAQLTADRARALLLSPLGGADAADLRRLARALRAEERTTGVPVRTSADLLRAAVAQPGLLAGVPDRLAAPAERLAGLLRRARRALRDDGPEQALWELWSGTPWPRRLERTALAGGPAGRAADRDLDAVVALFDVFARSEERRPRRGVANLLAELDAEQIPADPLAERTVPGACVRLSTAHRAKGLEWDLVVVAGVQEGSWPDLRRRASLLEPDRLGRDGLCEPADPVTLLAEERRLFYVAVTRARRRLVVTAVASADDDGERPSRFLAELAVPVVHRTGPVRRPLSLAALVADLRAAAEDPATAPALRTAAADRLARLASVRVGGVPLVPAADPDRWWGTAAWTDPGRPLHDPAEPLRLSGTSLSGIDECPLAWFLRHEVHADRPTSAAMGFGGLLHALADDVATGASPADLTHLADRLDRVWHRLAFEAGWQSDQQRAAARAALARFLAWHRADRNRQLVATEVPFALPMTVEGRDLVLRGFVDRLERDDAGGVHIVDFKTGRNPPSDKSVAHHPQLGSYQLAAGAGVFTDVGVPADTPCAGAELVHLRVDGPDGLPKVQQQQPLGDDDWMAQLMAGAVRRIAAERFPPRPGNRCGVCEFRPCCPAQPEGRQVVP